jgi:hypothetical protein
MVVGGWWLVVGGWWLESLCQDPPISESLALGFCGVAGVAGVLVLILQGSTFTGEIKSADAIG